MANNVYDIITLDDMKGELRRERGDISLDREIERAMETAVAHVSGRTCLPLIATQKHARLYDRSRSQSTKPIHPPDPWIVSVQNILYYMPDEEWSDVPTGTIAGADVSLRDINGQKFIDPPDGGWPEMYQSPRSDLARFLVDYTADFTITHETAYLRSAIILVARDIFQGTDAYMARGSSAEALISKWTRRGAI